MKVAVCLSGHLRTFDKTHQSVLDQLLNKYNCDVFVSTWTNLGNAFAYHANYKDGADKTDPIISQEKIIEMYKPISIHMDNADTEPVSNQLKKDYNEIRTQNRAHMAQIMCMLYKIWDCNELKKAQEEKGGFKYDVVVRLRFDVYLKCVNLELTGHSVHFIPGHMGVADFVFIGPSQEMDNVCDIYTVMSPNIPFNQFENIEHMWAAHLMNNDIPFDVSVKVFEYLRYANAGIYDMFGKKVGDY